MKPAALSVVTLLLLFASPGSGQDLPDKIRGYKVYNANIRVETGISAKGDRPGETEAVVTLGDPEIVDFGISGVTFEIKADIGSIDQTGKVDFVSFNDIRINGFAVEIDEYGHSFEFKKGVAIRIPAPVRVFVSSKNIAKAAFRELFDSKKDWKILGTAFVFGKFKKFGFSFKRVVPVKIDVKFKNPIR